MRDSAIPVATQPFPTYDELVERIHGQEKAVGRVRFDIGILLWNNVKSALIQQAEAHGLEYEINAVGILSKVGVFEVRGSGSKVMQFLDFAQKYLEE